MTTAVRRGFPSASDGTVPVSWAGGVLAAPVIFDAFVAGLGQLCPAARLCEPRGDSLSGALRLATAGRCPAPGPGGRPRPRAVDALRSPRPGPDRVLTGPVAGVFEAFDVAAMTWAVRWTPCSPPEATPSTHTSAETRVRGKDVVRVPGARMALSTASVYPESTATAFELAARLGYDGVEVMVGADPLSQDVNALRRLSEYHQLPIVSIHAPTLLITQRVWGIDPWGKLDRSAEAAKELGREGGRRPPTVSLAARLRPRLRRGRGATAGGDGDQLRGREHVPVEGRRAGTAGLPSRLGPARLRLCRGDARHVAHGHRGRRRLRDGVRPRHQV